MTDGHYQNLDHPSDQRFTRQFPNMTKSQTRLYGYDFILRMYYTSKKIFSISFSTIYWIQQEKIMRTIEFQHSYVVKMVLNW